MAECTALGKTFKNSEDCKLYLIYKNPDKFKDYILKIAQKGIKGNKLTLKQIREMGAYSCAINNINMNEYFEKISIK